MTTNVTDHTAVPPAAGDVRLAFAREYLDLSAALPPEQMPPSVMVTVIRELRRHLGAVLAVIDDSQAYTAGQRVTLREALVDALAWQQRDSHLDCRDWDQHPASLASASTAWTPTRRWPAS
jgi:hypothetical protein